MVQKNNNNQRRSNRLKKTNNDSEQPSPTKRVTRATAKKLEESSKNKPAETTEEVTMAVENQDIEMEHADEVDDTEKKALEADALLLSDLRQNFILLERAVSTIESRFTTRVLRTTASIRKRLTGDLLAQAIRDIYPK
ncbi:13114_t:CDS:2, partial [Cetraspora pellucida]